MRSDPFEFRLITSAQRDLVKLPLQLQARIVSKLEQLVLNPFPPQSEKLSGRENSYRARLGDYRILFFIDLEEHVVWVTSIAHRREVYR